MPLLLLFLPPAYRGSLTKQQHQFNGFTDDHFEPAQPLDLPTHRTIVSDSNHPPLPSTRGDRFLVALGGGGGGVDHRSRAQDADQESISSTSTSSGVRSRFKRSAFGSLTRRHRSSSVSSRVGLSPSTSASSKPPQHHQQQSTQKFSGDLAGTNKRLTISRPVLISNPICLSKPTPLGVARFCVRG